jgi:hypothetical protein
MSRHRRASSTEIRVDQLRVTTVHDANTVDDDRLRSFATNAVIKQVREQRRTEMLLRI